MYSSTRCRLEHTRSSPQVCVCVCMCVYVSVSVCVCLCLCAWMHGFMSVFIILILSLIHKQKPACYPTSYTIYVQRMMFGTACRTVSQTVSLCVHWRHCGCSHLTKFPLSLSVVYVHPVNTALSTTSATLAHGHGTGATQFAL